jgi:hypothetical protein
MGHQDSPKLAIGTWLSWQARAAGASEQVFEDGT